MASSGHPLYDDLHGAASGSERGGTKQGRHGGLARGLGLEVDFCVRTLSDWKAIITGNPFPQQAERDPSHLLVMCLKEEPDREDVTALQGAIANREVVCAKGRQAYLVYPDGIGRSRLTSALIETKLRTRGTARNWNTVLKLEALAEAL